MLPNYSMFLMNIAFCRCIQVAERKFTMNAPSRHENRSIFWMFSKLFVCALNAYHVRGLRGIEQKTHALSSAQLSGSEGYIKTVVETRYMEHRHPECRCRILTNVASND